MTTPVPPPGLLDDIDAIVALAIMREEHRAPLRGSDAIAVRAIVELSRAGAELMTDAAVLRDVGQLSLRARRLLDLARELIIALAEAREVDR